MARTTTQLRDVVLTEGGFDSSRWSTAAVGWLNERHKDMVTKAKWRYADSYSVGSTTASQDTYTLPALAISIDWVEVAGERYEQASPAQIDGLYDGTLTSDDDAGLFTANASADGATKKLRLWPMPDTSSLAITAHLALSPADLDTSSSNPIIPEHLEPGLIAGAIATGKVRAHERPDLAQTFEQMYQQDGVLELTKFRRLGVGGTGPRSVPVKGWHF